MTIGKAIARAWTDAAYKDKLARDPHAALAEVGLEVPAGTAITVVEDTDQTVHLVLPAPPSGAGDMSLEELEAVAAGGSHEYVSEQITD